MRIAHVIPTLDPAAGGPPMVAARLAAAQASIGHSIYLISYDTPSAREQIDLMTAKIPYLNEVNRVVLPRLGRIEKITSANAEKQLQHLFSEVEFVHLHGLWEPLLVAASSAARMGRKPFAIAPHGMLNPWSLRNKRIKKKIALAFRYHRILRQAAFLHVLNADEKRYVRALRINRPSELIPNGVFLQEMEPLPARDCFRKRNPQLEDHPYILFLSRLHHVKGLDYLEGAFQCVANQDAHVQLVVAGPDEGARDDFMNRVRDAGLEKRVHLVGPIYGRDKLAALVDAAAFCLPSRQEGFSVAITEALACRVPVVISENCHFPEVAQAGAGEVVPLRVEAVADALLKVLGDSDMQKRMGDAGRRLVEDRYTWPKVAEQTIAAYERALAREKRK